MHLPPVHTAALLAPQPAGIGCGNLLPCSASGHAEHHYGDRPALWNATDTTRALLIPEEDWGGLLRPQTPVTTGNSHEKPADRGVPTGIEAEL